MMGFRCVFALLAVLVSPSGAAALPSWTAIEPAALVDIDDDVSRNITNKGFFTGIKITEVRFSENGFNWHLMRFASVDRPEGPTWVVPHDDENAAFDAMIAAIHKYGGVGIAVNSGQGSSRVQIGGGICGVKRAAGPTCDPNRNFGSRAPMFTATIVDMFGSSHPVIALHTNSPGFSGDGAGGRGDITIYERAAFARNEVKPRKYARLAMNPPLEMANPDSFALSAFLMSQGQPPKTAQACAAAMAQSGIHFWHEPVRSSDGSLSNYLALNRPDIAYMNAESRAEADLALAARRHAIMIEAYLENCLASWNKPVALP